MKKMDISEIDPNFKAVRIGENDFDFYDVRTAPLEITGVFWDEDKDCFARLPESVIVTSGSIGLPVLGLQTAGGQVRFTTDSKSIAIKFELREKTDMLHMPRSGSSGFDLFHEQEFIGKAWQSNQAVPADQCLMAANLPGGLREYTINMPLYNGVLKMYLGLLPGSTLGGPTSGPRKKACFYGSSITQGGCASKPGNAYTSMICRWLRLEQFNMGFSGNGKGEPIVAEYIASQRPDIFVLDYDYNAPTLEHLQKTHEPFFRIIRNALPTLPVVMVSKPNKNGEGEFGTYQQRREVIKATYNNALARGDERVFFVDGSELFDGPDRSACTMDNCHPNDLGFYRMACGIGAAVKEALKLL